MPVSDDIACAEAVVAGTVASDVDAGTYANPELVDWIVDAIDPETSEDAELNADAVAVVDAEAADPVA